jgi:hypothetical protein
MTGDGGDARGPEPSDVEGTPAANLDVRARQQLIQAMIENNSRQLKFESARAGADIERACALRDCARDAADADAAERLREVEQRLHRLEEEHRRAVAEREWLSQSLFEFDRRPESDDAGPRRRPT